MNKEEILSEYFLAETEKTEEMRGWKVVGTIDGCVGQSVSPLLELKTDGDGWLCDFKIKLLHCGIVLASPEYVIDEDELVMEAMEKVWKVWGVAQQLQEIMSQQIQKKLNEATITYPHDSWTWSQPDSGTWTNTICNATNAATYIPALDHLDSAITAATTAINDYTTAYASTCSC